MAYTGRPRPKEVPFFRLNVHNRVGQISQVEVYLRVANSVIQKGAFNKIFRTDVAVSDNRAFKNLKTTTVTATGTSLKKNLMGKTMAMHVRCNSLYISLPSSAKTQHEITKFCVVWRT